MDLSTPRAGIFSIPFGGFTVFVSIILKGEISVKQNNRTYYFIVTAMLSAVAGILMSLEFSLPLMPPFYKVDFSDVPSVIATFLLGPVSKIQLGIYGYKQSFG